MDPYFKLMGEALAHQNDPAQQHLVPTECAGNMASGAKPFNRPILQIAAPLATFIPHHIAFDDWIETILERLHDLGGQHAERGAAALSDRPFHSQPNNVEAQA